MQTVFMLLSIAGLSYFMSSTNGPFGLFTWLRKFLSNLPLVGSTMAEALTCPFCLGAWSGLGFYLLTNQMGTWSLGQAFLWCFGSGMFNLVSGRYVESLVAKQ